MKKTKYYCKVKFKEDAGKIWCNSNKKVNPHHTFFKSDDFDIDIHMQFTIFPKVWLFS
jgi:hypothetical protein